MADNGTPDSTPRYQEILASADWIAAEAGHDYGGVEHLFLAILEDRQAVPTQVLADLVDPGAVAEALVAFLASPEYGRTSRIAPEQPSGRAADPEQSSR